MTVIIRTTLDPLVKAPSLRGWLVAALIFSCSCGSIEKDRSLVAQRGESYVQDFYRGLQPDWWAKFKATSGCDHMPLRHPDWNICMANIGAAMNRRSIPGYPPLRDLRLLRSVATRVEDVRVEGRKASVAVWVDAVCQFSDSTNYCLNTQRVPNFPFRARMTVTLEGKGLFSKEWAVTSATRDPDMERSREAAWRDP